jgi:hypothetical protein
LRCTITIHSVDRFLVGLFLTDLRINSYEKSDQVNKRSPSPVSLIYSLIKTRLLLRVWRSMKSTWAQSKHSKTQSMKALIVGPTSRCDFSSRIFRYTKHTPLYSQCMIAVMTYHAFNESVACCWSIEVEGYLRFKLEK